ncbi:hypothetical protein [Streptomyces sp. NPDC048438]|uniref:hypothetical protein n=1 Tax=Streptomyces sp. NPDC048438 TaxID=3365551 RepID=UPI0037122E1B
MSAWAITALLGSAAAVVLACRLGSLAAHSRSTGHQDVGPDPRTGLVWRACDSTICAHLQTEHDVLTPTRLMCRRCDHIVTTR